MQEALKTVRVLQPGKSKGLGARRLPLAKASRQMAVRASAGPSLWLAKARLCSPGAGTGPAEESPGSGGEPGTTGHPTPPVVSDPASAK